MWGRGGGRGGRVSEEGAMKQRTDKNNHVSSKIPLRRDILFFMYNALVFGVR